LTTKQDMMQAGKTTQRGQKQSTTDRSLS